MSRLRSRNMGRSAVVVAFVATSLACASGEKSRPAPKDDAPPPALSWSRAYIVKPVGNTPAAMYVTIANPTMSPDTLVRVTTPLVDVAMLHTNMASHQGHGGASSVMSMVPVTTIVVPADSSYALRPGGTHIMLTNLKQPVALGDSIPVTFHFTRAGALSGKAAVITYADVDSATAPAAAQ